MMEQSSKVFGYVFEDGSTVQLVEFFDTIYCKETNMIALFHYENGETVLDPELDANNYFEKV